MVLLCLRGGFRVALWCCFVVLLCGDAYWFAVLLCSRAVFALLGRRMPGWTVSCCVILCSYPLLARHRPDAAAGDEQRTQSTRLSHADPSLDHDVACRKRRRCPILQGSCLSRAWSVCLCWRNRVHCRARGRCREGGDVMAAFELVDSAASTRGSGDGCG